MKTLVFALLVAIIGVGKVQSFLCYSCENAPSFLNCLKTVKCAERDNFCATIVATTKIGNGGNTEYQITKRCSQKCTENDVDTGLMLMSSKCCTSTLCNNAREIA